MTNLENIGQFLLESDIETINKFIGEPVAISNYNYENASEDVIEFIYRLANAIRQKPVCSRQCVFRKGAER